MDHGLDPRDPRQRLREAVAEEVRVLQARRQVTQRVLAEILGKSEAYVSRRMKADVAFDLDDLALIAHHFDVPVAMLCPPQAHQLPVVFDQPVIPVPTGARR